MTKKIVNIIGSGLAGSEAAWQLANKGVKVKLYEMRRADKKTPAHHTKKSAELVCSNSFRNDEKTSAIGLLHEEMRLNNSLIIEAADNNKVPAGSALAVDRELFADYVTNKLSSHENIEIIDEEITELPQDENYWIIATGPLTSDSLSKSILKVTGEDKLAFFDAIAPIIYKDSIDFNKAWFQSRYDKIGPDGDGKDYINCPLNKEQYYEFIEKLLNSEKTEFKDWEKDTPYFEGCMPIEVMAERGVETLRFGPMKPVGLTNPHSTEKPYAVVQLRQDNKLGTIYNMVGFQTKLKYGLQAEIFKTIPGLENAEFARLGGLHRNTFINSPKLLDQYLQLKNLPNIKFAGQITGVEGYVESAAIGLIAGKITAQQILNEEVTLPPEDTALYSLLAHITLRAETDTFQPMNINYGLFNKIETKKKLAKKDKQALYSKRALEKISNWQ